MFEDQASVLGQPKRNSWPQSSAHRTAQGQSPTVTEPDEPQLSRGSFDQQYAPHGNFSYANQYPGQQFYGTSPHQGHFATPSSHNQNGGYANQSHQLSQSLPQSSALAHFQTQSAPQAMPNNTQVANFFPATKPQPVVPGQASAAPRIDSSLFGADYVSDTTETCKQASQGLEPVLHSVSALFWDTAVLRFNIASCSDNLWSALSACWRLDIKLPLLASWMRLDILSSNTSACSQGIPVTVPHIA